MRFSSLAHSLTGTQNPLYALHERITREGREVVDLVRGNVNAHGIVFPPDLLNEILAQSNESARVYRPDSFGQPVAREAIAAYYRSRQIVSSQILITPGTSVSYWYCFQLLAERGDEILAPCPSYPLFDYIAEMCGVRLVQYDLSEDARWAIDYESLEDRITPRTRAIVLISPHNPTGMVADEASIRKLAEIAARHDLAIISDEVFGEFLFGLDTLPRPAFSDAPLVFTLNGFSKMFALPGMKIGWIAVTGAQDLVHRAMGALEMISDTFLPVNEIAQFAAPSIFERGAPFLGNYRNWIASCRSAALDGLSGMEFAAPAGGFYVTVPIGKDEEEAALSLLEHSSVLAHPGHFYDIPGNHLVATFIHELDRLRTAFAAIAAISR
ncbi:MAG TPA: pyridoxal phosphate-dependent aminotransferase [Terriglobia bacterium]|nr:pyridoxal phosphate-dependent aminotransferase [Terriglobia bacterium]